MGSVDLAKPDQEDLNLKAFFLKQPKYGATYLFNKLNSDPRFKSSSTGHLAVAWPNCVN